METTRLRDSVTPERLARLRRIFEEALERPPRERRTYLAVACGDDERMLNEVLGMLATEGVADPVLDERPPSSAPEEGRFPAGTVLVGRYRVLGLLGRG